MVCGEEFLTARRYSRYFSMAGFMFVAVESGVQDLAPTGAASSCLGAGAGSSMSFSQSQPSLMQARTMPILDFFSTMKGAPHLGQGSARGMNGVVKSQSG